MLGAWEKCLDSPSLQALERATICQLRLAELWIRCAALETRPLLRAWQMGGELHL